MITHALAAVVGGAFAVALGLGQGAPTNRAEGPAATPTNPPPPVAAAPSSPRPTHCPDPPTRPEPTVAEPDARTLLLELQKASAEATLAELGAMPIAWAELPDAPPALQPGPFEASVARAAAALGLAMPEVDCSEFPCVVIARDEWTREELAALRDAVRRETDVADAKPFGVDHGAARMFGIDSEGTATPKLLQRIWFRVREATRDAANLTPAP